MRQTVKFVPLFLSTIFILSLELSAQLSFRGVDSLKTELNKERNDSVRVMILANLGRKLIYEDTVKAEVYILEALSLSRKIGYYWGEMNAAMARINQLRTQGKNQAAIAFADQIIQNNKGRPEYYLMDIYNELGHCYYVLVDYENSIEAFQRGLEIARLSENKFMINFLTANLAVLYDEQGNKKKALEMYFKALKNAKYDESSSQLLDLYINISSCYFELGELKTAIKFGHKALQLVNSVDEGRDKLGEVICHGNLADFYFAADDFSQATEFANHSLKVAVEIVDKPGVINAYRLLGKIQKKEGRLEEALSYFEKALRIGREIKDTQNTCMVERELAYLYIELHQLNKAVESADRSLEVAKEIGSAIDIRDGYQLNSKVQEVLGNVGLSLDFYKKYVILKDSLFGEQNAQDISNLRTNYDLEKKEQEIESLSQLSTIQSLEIEQSNSNLIIMGVLFLIFLSLAAIMYLIYRQRQLALSQKSQNMEQKLLRVQMNPHFIFNAMSAIQEYMVKGDAKKASSFLTKFSRLIRQVLDNSRNEYIGLDQEVSMLDSYLTLQNLRREIPFEYDIQVDENIDPEEFAIPPMFAQPFVENAIEHGLNENKVDARILIRFSMDGESLIMQISDNGIGMKETMKMAKTEHHISYATQITKERMQLFRQLTHKNILFNIENLNPGTRIIFNLPFQYV